MQPGSEAKAHFRQQLVRAVQDLPSMPALVMRILELTETASVNAVEIEKLILTDPALSAKILRVVNSAYYGLERKVTSVQQAIVILGFRHLRNLVLAVSALSRFRNKSPHFREVQRRIWERAFGAATLSRELCRVKGIRESEAEVAYVGALLHDIGELFLFSSFTNIYTELVKRAESLQIPTVQAERKALGLDHAEVGAELIRQWNFPPPLAIVVSRHEGPFLDDGDTVALCVHIASKLAGEFTSEPDRGQIDPMARAWLAMDDAAIDTLVECARPKVQEVASNLGLAA